MEVRPGFKLTEAGIIPNDWEVVPLGTLVQTIEYGSSAPSKPEGNVPVLRMGNLQSGKIDWQDLAFTIDPVEIQRYELHEGDVLFNRTNTIDLVGKTSIYEGERKAIFAGYLIRVVARPDKLDAKYLNFIMNTDLARKHSAKVLSVAVGQANINGQKLKTYPIPIPPTLSEQHAIATALSDVDALLGGLDQLIAKKRDLKQAAMQQLLTGQTRLPGFNGEWEAKRLGKLGDIKSGGTPSSTQAHFWDGDVPWCTPTDITALLGRKYLIDTARTISAAGLKASSAEVIPPRSLIITSRATIGECAINLVAMTTNQGFKNLVPFPENDVEFLYYLMTTQKAGLISLCGGSTFLEINKKQLSAYEVTLPKERDEQTAIASILSDMDAELTALTARRDKTRNLKLGMMQELLTGKTRLI